MNQMYQKKNKFQETVIRFSCEILVIIISSSDDDKISSPVFAVYGIINECALFFPHLLDCKPHIVLRDLIWNVTNSIG